MTYAIEISIDMGRAFSPVGDLVNGVNDELAKFGYEEKLSVRGKIITMNLTTERELTGEEIETVKRATIAQFNESRPAWKAQVESFRRQSGNVQQSAA